MVFVDPKIDIAFKKIFGNEQRKEILISFLNAVLDFTNNKSIIDIHLTNPYQIPTLPELKESILDIKAKNRNGDEFIVEMQNRYVKSFEKRSLYYSAKAYVSQLGTGEAYDHLKKVYFIGILNFNLFDSVDYIKRHLILDSKTHEHKIDDIEFCFIEVDRFNKGVSELESITDKWIYFIKEANRLTKIPEVLAKERAIKEAFEVANQKLWGQKELDIYTHHQINERSNQATLEEAIEKAEERGEQKGIQKGKIEEQIEIAKRLIGNGVDIEIIAQSTTLSKDEIVRLKGDRA